MNTPKGEVSWLERFPPDIWAYFACYLPGEQLGRLTMTGATLLGQRLKSPGVVKSIKLGEDLMIFKSFPKFLSDFHSLDELYIHSKSDQWSSKLGLKIDSIPSGVRKLVLSGDWDGSAHTLFGEDGATLKLNEHLPHLEVLDFNWIDLPSESWIGHSPQSLTTLKLRGWNGTIELPTSLIHFVAYEVDLSASSFVSKLPTSLETFEVRYLNGIELVVPLLPPSTRKLSAGSSPSYSDGPISPQNLLEQLPKSLTWFEVPDTLDIDFVPNPELISFLPSTLTDLQIAPVLPCSAWHLLPPQLTNLSMSIDASLCTVASKIVDGHGEHHEVRSIPFDALPKSITSLGLYGADLLCGPPIHPDRSYFPPQLAHLSLSGVQLSPETAKLLPSSLTYLQIANLCERVCEHLPSGLKTLRSQAALITPNLIKFLPKSLTCLRLQIPDSDDPWFDSNTGKTMGSISKLEDYAIHKSCLSPSFDWKDHSPLPSTLTELSLPHASELGDTFLQHQHLPNLIELNLADSQHFTDLSIPLLSSRLRVLDLGCSSNISGKSFQFLPRSLIRLDLYTSESIFDSDIQHLPRTLKQALFDHAIHLTDLCVSDLPPHLEWLNMQCNSQISTSSFPKFPDSLRSTQSICSAMFSEWEVSYGVACVK